MDFVTVCQALGLAIAAGLVIGVAVPSVMPSWGVLAGAIPIGIVLGVMILSGDDEPVWPAILTGALGGGLAGIVSRDVAAGANRRAGNAGDVGAAAPAGIAAIVVVAAVVIAGLSLVAGPLAIVAFVALLWIWLMRRRQAEQKHEGLRVLR